MKTARMITPGASSAAARTFSLSSRRVRRETRVRPPLTAIASFKRRRSAPGVDLAELARGPFHRLLGLHLAAGGARVHHGDDVLVPRLGSFLVGLASVAH